MKLSKQILAIALAAAVFAAFDIAVYNVVTKRYINHNSEGMQAKSVELSKYLPFEENSEIVKLNSSFKLTGDLPVIDGAAALYPVFSAFVNAVYPKDSVSFDGENFTPDSTLHYTNTRGAYKAIVDGDADLIFCAKPSEEQLAYAKEKGVELELIPIGREAFVFIVNAENPVNSLTEEQVRDIYSGKIRNWAEVGGKNRLINALERNEGSGSQTRMLSFMGDKEIKRNIFGALTGSAIGFSFRYYVEGIVGNSGVKMLSINGVYPDKEHIENGEYPLSSNFYAVCRKDDENANLRALIDWILSDEGQEIIDKSGYVPLG